MSEFTMLYDVLMLIMMFIVTSVEVYSVMRIHKQDHKSNPVIPPPHFPISHIPQTPFNVPSMSNCSSYNQQP